MPIQSVIEHMRILNELHGRLLDIADRKKNALVRNAIEEINSMVNQEVKLVRQISVADTERVQAIRQFLEEQGVHADDSVTVSDVVRLVFNAEERRQLMKEREQLLGRIDRLKELNELNQQLIQQSLAYLEYSLDVISGAPDSDVVYQRPQSSPSFNTSRRGLFDTKA